MSYRVEPHAEGIMQDRSVLWPGLTCSNSRCTAMLARLRTLIRRGTGRTG
jgi:hypothetical protein